MSSDCKKYSQKFRKEWLKMKEFSSWLCEVPGDSTKAHCKFCRCDILAKLSLISKHRETKKHKSAVPCQMAPLKSFFVPKCDETAKVEASLALHICCHSSFNSCDHLVDLCKNAIKDSAVTSKIKMHRTKCTAIVKNVLSIHFEQDLITDIGDNKFSLLLDESTDVTVSKLLGIVIIYYSRKHKKVIHTFLSLITLENCDANGIVNALKEELSRLKLNIKKLIAIGTDNASVMVGVNNGIYAKLKMDVPGLILIRCVCHSLQLAVSHASKEALPRCLEFLVAETYKWFAHSSSRQASYKQLYETINENRAPLKILNNCATRWLSIEPAIGRVLNQWLELKTHFGIARLSEKCYTAEILYDMYKDEKNLLYILALHPVLVQVQQVNKAFESNITDKTKLFEDLTRLIKSIARILMLQSSRVDPILSNIEGSLDPEPNLGYRFEKKVMELNTENIISKDDVKNIRKRSQQFLLHLFQQLKQRLPENITLLKHMSCFSVQNTLKHIKDSVSPILHVMLTTDEEIAAAELQYNSIHLNQWINITKTETFWAEVNEYEDASGSNPFKEITECALNLLVLPNSNAEVERVFSSMNIVKNKLKNRMQLPLLNAILKVKYGLKRHGKCCQNYDIPVPVINLIGNMATYSHQEESSNSQKYLEDILLDEDNTLF